MFGAGAAWGIYSLRGRTTGSPVEATAGNFLRATLFAAVLSILLLADSAVDARGVACAVASGALASGLGYVLWYQALAELRATSAGIVQLSVPALAAVGGSLLLDEPVTLHLLLASAAILGGVALATVRR
jgi:drug/metabolite transporter (DMT)-like permease